MMMKIGKSKRQLAQLLTEAGVTQFPEGADWAAQDKSWNQYAKCAMFYRGADKPEVCKGDTAWRPFGDDSFLLNKVEPIALASSIPNWHQTVLSRDEFDQIAAETVVPSEPDADGWIEWEGSECPVKRGTLVDVKYANGVTNYGVSALTDKTSADHVSGTAGSMLATNWGPNLPMSGIVAYRLHKLEQEESMWFGVDMSKDGDSTAIVTLEPTAAPTLDQLLQDWRNADDYAQRKQVEADEAAAMRDERWQAVQARAGEMGVTVERCESVAAEHGQVEPVMTGKFRNTKIGSPKSYEGHLSEEVCDECGMRFGQHFNLNCKS